MSQGRKHCVIITLVLVGLLVAMILTAQPHPECEGFEPEYTMSGRTSCL